MLQATSTELLMSGKEFAATADFTILVELIIK